MEHDAGRARDAGCMHVSTRVGKARPGGGSRMRWATKRATAVESGARWGALSLMGVGTACSREDEMSMGSRGQLPDELDAG